MILTYEFFVKKLNDKIKSDADFYYDLLKNVIDNPNRYTGIFRLSNAKTKLIQNVTQSREIKFGDFMEEIVTVYIDKMGYQNLNKRIGTDENGDALNADQVFLGGNTVFLIEQKIRDDHDSSKKEGQINNFKNKINSLQSKCSDKRKKLKCYFWFIDEGFVKYKSFYFNEIKKVTQSFVKTKNLCYGRSIIDDLLGKDCWDNFEEAYNSVKKSFSNGFINTILKYNFDEDKKDIVFKILKNKRKKTIDKLLNNSEYTEVRNILFPNNIVLNKIKQHFDV